MSQPKQQPGSSKQDYRIVGIQRFSGHDCWKLQREDYERANFIPLPDGWVPPQ